MPDQTPDLTIEELEDLRYATLRSYEAGEYPAQMTTQLRHFTEQPDGGLVALIDLAIGKARRIAALEAERERLRTDMCQAQNGMAEQTKLIRRLQNIAAIAVGQPADDADEDLVLRQDVWDQVAAMGEPVAAQATPHAYIAVKRYFSPNADGPEWEWDAAVIPAGEHSAWEREDHQKRGYELLPIVGTENGTRFVAEVES